MKIKQQILKNGITPEMVKAAQTVFVAKAVAETIKPIVSGYQSKILEFFQFKNKKGEVVLNPSYSYTLDAEDLKIYYAECNKEREKAGLKVDNPEFCPLLVAESLEREAKRCLFEVMAEALGFDNKLKEGFYYNLKLYKEFIELTLKMLAPLCKDLTVTNFLTN